MSVYDEVSKIVDIAQAQERNLANANQRLDLSIKLLKSLNISDEFEDVIKGIIEILENVQEDLY